GPSGATHRRTRYVSIDCLARVAHGAPEPDDGLHWGVDLGSYRLHWERHTEFSTLTLNAPGGDRDSPFGDPVTDLLPKEWVQALPGKLIAAAHVTFLQIEEDLSAREIERGFEGQRLIVTSVMQGRATVWTALRAHGDGFVRYLVIDHGMEAQQLGRLAQRIVELDTYRSIALLGLLMARSIAPETSKMEAELASITADLGERETPIPEREMLGRLVSLAGRAEAVQARSAFRFGATEAYGALVTDRLRELQEKRVPPYQPLSEFLERRFEPALRYCASIAGRQGKLSERIARTSGLVRTRVDIGLQEQNQQLLRSIQKRAAQQIRLQETVEGLSVVAISYYGVSLLSYLLKGSHIWGYSSREMDTVLAICVPVILIGLWLIVRRYRKKLRQREAEIDDLELDDL
ncbi:MAG: DUF3422 domain-containing protein, partial [Pseudomonadota bacterium]